MVVSKLPSPLELKSERIKRLLCPRDRDFNTLPDEIKCLKERKYYCIICHSIVEVVLW